MIQQGKARCCKKPFLLGLAVLLQIFSKTRLRISWANAFSPIDAIHNQQEHSFRLHQSNPKQQTQQQQDFAVSSNSKSRRRKQSTDKSDKTSQNFYPRKKQESAKDSVATNSFQTQIRYNDNNANAQLDYESVDNDSSSKSIGCEHFGVCPGCSVMDSVTSVDVIRSARLYFDALARQKLMGVPQQLRTSRKGGVMDVYSSDNQSNFRVVIPTKSVRQWRTQAKLVVAGSASKNPWSKSSSSSTSGAGCIFGLYQRNSHSVVSIPNCQVHHPSINQAVQALEMATAKVQTPACMEETSTGGSRSSTSTSNTLRTGLRYVQLQVERATGKICLTLVWFARDVKETQPALSRLTKELTKSQPELWHSIWLHCHDGLGNNIFSRSPQASWHLLSGPELLRERLPKIDDDHAKDDRASVRKDDPWLYFTPQTFRQANLDGFEVLALHVARAVPPAAKVCELYAGVGVLGLTAFYFHAAQGDPLTWLRCSDENPSNPRCFHRAVNSLPPSVSGRDPTKPRRAVNSRQSAREQSFTMAQLVEQMTKPESASNKRKRNTDQGEKTSYLVASAGAALMAGQALGANVLIVDPPRKGLDEDVLVELCKPINANQDDAWESPTLLPIPDEKVNWANSVKTLIYVSCGFEALTRDCDRLFSNRGAGWRLQSATGYVLFPGSDHVETICVFQRE